MRSTVVIRDWPTVRRQDSTAIRGQNPPAIGFDPSTASGCQVGAENYMADCIVPANLVDLSWPPHLDDQVLQVEPSIHTTSFSAGINLWRVAREKLAF